MFFGLSLMGFPITRLLGKGFHTLIKGVSLSSPTNVGYHNPLVGEENETPFIRE